MSKVKEKENFKSSKRKASSHIQVPIGLSVDFSTETLQTRREWDDIVKVLKGKKPKTCQPRMLHPAKLAFRNEEKIL